MLDSLKSMNGIISNTIPTIGRKEDAVAAKLLKRNRNNIAKLYDEMTKFIAENSNEVIKDLIRPNTQTVNQQNIRLEEIEDTQQAAELKFEFLYELSALKLAELSHQTNGYPVNNDCLNTPGLCSSRWYEGGTALCSLVFSS